MKSIKVGGRPASDGARWSDECETAGADAYGASCWTVMYFGQFLFVVQEKSASQALPEPERQKTHPIASLIPISMPTLPRFSSHALISTLPANLLRLLVVSSTPTPATKIGRAHV